MIGHHLALIFLKINMQIVLKNKSTYTKNTEFINKII